MRQPTWLATNSGWGSYRATFPPLQTDAMVARLMWMPPGQRSPWHGSGGWPEMGQPVPPLGDGAIFLAVEGEVEFSAGGATFAMEPKDVLLVNAVVYSYQNTSLAHCLFWTVQPRRRSTPAPADDEGDQVVWRGDPAASALSGSHPYYDAEPPPAPDALDRMSIVPWRDQRRAEIAWHGEWGSHWGAYPAIEAGVCGRMVRVPAGQRTAPRTADHDVLLLGVDDGAVEVEVDTDHCSVGTRDALLIPAGQAFSYLNAGSRDALAFEVWPRA